MDVTRAGQPVPDLFEIDGIAAGNIYIARWNADHTALDPDLADGVPVVLWTQHGETRELTTRRQIGGVPTEEGTYVNQVDLARFNNTSSPHIRLYTWRDTLAKVRSPTGVALLLPAILALLTAVAGVFFLLSSQDQPSTTTIADRALVIIDWATAPGTAKAGQARSCLLAIEGHQVPAATIPGVKCVPPVTPWWQSTVTGSLVTGGIAVLAALIGIFTLPSHYRFGKNPVNGS